MERELVPLAEASFKLGIGRTLTYEYIAQGKLRAVKVASKTLVVAESLREFINGLPDAIKAGAIRPQRAASTREAA
jgi:YD repeat-containing protein